MQLGKVVIRRIAMTEGLFECYFRLLAGRLLVAEYGVIAEVEDVPATAEALAEAMSPDCLC